MEDQVEGCIGCITEGCIGVNELKPFAIGLGYGFGRGVLEVGLRAAKELRVWSGVMVRDWGFIGVMTPDMEDVLACWVEG